MPDYSRGLDFKEKITEENDHENHKWSGKYDNLSILETDW